MAKAIFNVLFKIISAIVNVVLYPINSLVGGLVPDLSNILTSFSETVNIIGGNALDYITHLIPPITLNVVKIYLGFLVTYYTISITVHGILKMWTIIKNIKIW